MSARSRRAVGVKALAACPRPPAKSGAGDQGVVVGFAGVTFTPGHLLWGDRDGLVVGEPGLCWTSRADWTKTNGPPMSAGRLGRAVVDRPLSIRSEPKCSLHPSSTYHLPVEASRPLGHL